MSSIHRLLKIPKKYLLIIIGFAIIIAIVLPYSLIYVSFKQNINHCILFIGNNNQLLSYNISQEEICSIKFEGYVEYYAIGSYSVGDFCCVALDDNSNPNILFVKDSRIERVFSLPFCPREILANSTTLYCLVENVIYCVNMYTEQIKIYAENVSVENGKLNMFLSQDGKLLYLRYNNKESLGEIVYNEEESVISIAEAVSGLGFVSSSEFLYLDSNYKNKIVTVNNGQSHNIIKYNKCAQTIILSNNQDCLATFYTSGESGGFATLYVMDRNSGIYFRTKLNNFDMSVPFAIN